MADATGPISLTGRGDELALLEAALEQATSGSPQVVMVDGDPGAGKTTLLSSFLERSVDPRAVRWVRCDQFEAGVELAAAGLLLSNQHEPVSEIDAGRRLLQFLGDLQDSAAGTGVLVIDDAQWMDRSSVQAFRFALRRLHADAVLTMIARRPPDGPDHWVDLTTDSGPLIRLQLTPLDPDAVAQLVERTRGWQVTASLASYLVERTGGSPLLVSAVLRDARTPDDLDTAQLPASAAAAVERILGTVDAGARGLVEAVAVLAQPADLVAVGRVADLESPSSALGTCLNSGLLVQNSDGKLDCAHSLLRDAVVAAMPPYRKRTVHARAAQWTTGDRQLDHRVAAADRPDASLATDLSSAAEKARQRGQFGVAVRQTLHARSVTEDQAQRDVLTLHALIDSVRAHDVAVAQPLADETGIVPDTTLKSFALGLLATEIGDVPQAKEMLRRAAAQAAQAQEPVLRARADLALAEIHASLNESEDAIAVAADGDDTTDVELRSDLRTVRAVGLWQQGDLGQALHLLDDAPAGEKGASWQPDLIATRGMLHLNAGDLAEAMTDLDSALALGPLWRPTPNYARAFVQRATARYYCGDWDGAVVDAAAARAVADAGSHTWPAPLADAVASFVPANRGQWELAAGHLDRARAGMRAVHSTPVMGAVIAGQVMLATAREDYSGVRRALTPLRFPMAMQRLGPARAFRWVMTSWILACLHLGELDTAQTSIAEYEGLLHHWPGGPVPSRLGWLKGQLAEAGRDPDAARRLYADDLAAPALAATPFLHAQVLHTAGRLDRATGRRRDAIDKLRAAQTIFGRLRAAPYLERCTADLSACGLASDAPEVLALSEREEDVVALVARGYTNREVAAELFVTAKTVEYHLRNVYAKLGLSSRRELRQLRGR